MVLAAMPVSCLEADGRDPLAQSLSACQALHPSSPSTAPLGDKSKLIDVQAHCPRITSNHHLQSGCRAADCAPLLDLPFPSFISLQRSTWLSTCELGFASPTALELHHKLPPLLPGLTNLPCSSPPLNCLQAGHAMHPQCPFALHHKLLYWTCLRTSLLPTACHRGPPGAGNLPGG